MDIGGSFNPERHDHGNSCSGTSWTVGSMATSHHPLAERNQDAKTGWGMTPMSASSTGPARVSKDGFIYTHSRASLKNRVHTALAKLGRHS